MDEIKQSVKPEKRALVARDKKEFFWLKNISVLNI